MFYKTFKNDVFCRRRRRRKYYNDAQRREAKRRRDKEYRERKRAAKLMFNDELLEDNLTLVLCFPQTLLK